MLVGIASGFATSLFCLGILMWMSTSHPPAHESSTGIDIVARSWSGRSITCGTKKPLGMCRIQLEWPKEAACNAVRNKSMSQLSRHLHSLEASEKIRFSLKHCKDRVILAFPVFRTWSYRIRTLLAAEEFSPASGYQNCYPTSQVPEHCGKCFRSWILLYLHLSRAPNWFLSV